MKQPKRDHGIAHQRLARPTDRDKGGGMRYFLNTRHFWACASKVMVAMKMGPMSIGQAADMTDMPRDAIYVLFRRLVRLGMLIDMFGLSDQGARSVAHFHIMERKVAKR